MRNLDALQQDVIARQERMLRLAERDYDLPARTLSAETGIPVATLNSYRLGTAMPLHAFVKLCRVIPDDLTSLMLEPAGKHVGSNEPQEGDVTALGCEASGYVADFVKRSADGVLCHNDRQALAQRARRMTPIARTCGAQAA